MKYCKDCRWKQRTFFLPYCKKPNKPTYLYDDPVKGARIETLKFCDHQREDYTWVETCGREGKWFEPRPRRVKALFGMWWRALFGV